MASRMTLAIFYTKRVATERKTDNAALTLENPGILEYSENGMIYNLYGNNKGSCRTEFMCHCQQILQKRGHYPLFHFPHLNTICRSGRYWEILVFQSYFKQNPDLRNSSTYQYQ